jgi:isoleucyl-tRNA synthetase
MDDHTLDFAGNVAVAAGKDIMYVKVEGKCQCRGHTTEKLILAEAMLEKALARKK